MDPRPYNYEFRRPRYNNPTFKSNHLYESIYHLRSYGRDIAPIAKPDNKRNQFVQEHWQKGQQHDKNNQIQKKEIQHSSVPKIEYQRKQEVRQHSQNIGEERHQFPSSRSQNSMSNYGNRIMKDEDRVYERQEKAFNIVTNYPKEYQNVHRKFPKYTLENYLIEKNLHPTYE